MRNRDGKSKKERGKEKERVRWGQRGKSRIANTVKVGQRWERLIARPSGWIPRNIKRGRAGKREGRREKKGAPLN